MAEIKTALVEPGGYYTSKYSGEEIDALLDSIGGTGGSTSSGVITSGTAELTEGAPLASGTLYVQYE